MTDVTGDWLTAQGTQTVMAMLEEAGFVAYAVGGCVRNALLGEPVADVDISTDARPETVIALAKEAGLKPVPTGIEHGTITVVCDGEGYEVTTFRADIETDGRRAAVRFADDVAEDAVRRDFTMNALYADRRGALVDPLGGLPDLHARRFRFIQDPTTRIREDYLRILRFFRFSAWYADPSQGMDPEALAAISANLDGLDILSAERVGAELTKLLRAPDPLFAVAVMEQTGVLAHVLPGAVSKPLGPLILHEEALGLRPCAMRRLAGIGFYDGARLRLSKNEQRQLEAYQRLIGAPDSLPEIAYRHSAQMARDVMVLRAASFEMPPQIDALGAIDAAADAQFPVKAADLMPAVQGAALGQTLKALEARWIASGFTLDKAALLSGL
ncbi:CCA tRNA nucleotidyltransferase [Tropicibacter naphthalenivorans]|uniref:CCA-adding enzyme n=1 Tax=Tropicibacter naphthalenivorans TaxID=441103 RepID=A0A0P1GDE4_9RHOB|nr:CCA tRNA nucleotidyltransferase [Tropicibacter naphthalenivorans]CUH79596.1 CCA-adding enzyme [Tropicibacter naphthalenivorans]SMC73673.1 poly(A) polymerase [Tropicibacter naphthalenivorans]